MMAETQENDAIMQFMIEEREKINGIDIVLSSNRIPTHGLYTMDGNWFSKRKLQMDSKGITEALFSSSFNMLGYMPEFNEINKP